MTGAARELQGLPDALPADVASPREDASPVQALKEWLIR